MNHWLNWIERTQFKLGEPLSIIPFPIKEFVGGSLELGLCSVRHNAIYEHVVDFEEHYDRILWVTCSYGPWPNIHVRD
jgi:hypothetical protein